MAKSKRSCSCGEPATRSTVFHRLKTNKTEDIITESVCEKCYKLFHLGLETMSCDKCGHEFYIDLDTFYDDDAWRNEIEGPYCLAKGCDITKFLLESEDCEGKKGLADKPCSSFLPKGKHYWMSCPVCSARVFPKPRPRVKPVVGGGKK